MAAEWAVRHLEERFVTPEIRSAGTHAHDGMEAAAYAIDAMRELGFDMRGHRSQRLDESLLDWADHVVVMEPMHAEIAALLMAPSAEAARVSGLWSHLEGQAGAVPDPHRLSLEVYRHSARSIGAAVQRLVEEQLGAQRSVK